MVRSVAQSSVSKIEWVNNVYPFHIAETLNDQHQGLLVVAHATKQEDHLWNQIPLLTCTIGLFRKLKSR